MAVDRVDLQYLVKEAARHMSAPKTSSWKLLTKIGRYLIGRPRLVMLFKWQDPTEMVTSFTDSDWAGCQITAKSTSGGIVCIGEHVIKTYSRQQKVIALSSAEAELYAMVAASAESLAIIAYAEDLGTRMSGEVYVDSSAALGISQRCGIGKVRHLRTQGLWVQEARLTGRLAYRKVLGAKNPADVLTKHVPAELLQKHLETLCVEIRGGRAETAPELNSLESVVLEFTQDDEKMVSFAAKVQYKAVPSENKGRKCKGRDRKRLEGRWEKPSTNAGGASPKSQTAVPTPRPRWADICEEEEQREKNEKASEMRELRGTRSVLQGLTEFCSGNYEKSAGRTRLDELDQLQCFYDEQSAIFGSTVDRFEPSVEGGALGFRGLRGLQ